MDEQRGTGDRRAVAARHGAAQRIAVFERERRSAVLARSSSSSKGLEQHPVELKPEDADGIFALTRHLLMQRPQPAARETALASESDADEPRRAPQRTPLPPQARFNPATIANASVEPA